MNNRITFPELVEQVAQCANTSKRMSELFLKELFVTISQSLIDGESVKVKSLKGEGPVKRRIMDMGITKGVEINLRKIAPLGDPIEVNVRGYELTLRKSEAENIEVE